MTVAFGVASRVEAGRRRGHEVALVRQEAALCADVPAHPVEAARAGRMNMGVSLPGGRQVAVSRR